MTFSSTFQKAIRRAAFIVVFFTLLHVVAKGQELFTYTEPASNMAAKSIGLRLNSIFPLASNKLSGTIINPEIMVGINKHLMVHGEVYSEANHSDLKYIGTGFYGKYRFYSSDEVHKHFRLAITQRLSFFNNIPASLPIQLTQRNSGSESGVIATQLVNKTAISVGVMYLQAWDNGKKNKLAIPKSKSQEIGYTFSAGQLVLPKTYVNYDQLNMNLMLEILGQTNLSSGRSFVDLAPSIQFIIKSRMRVDVGYRKAIINSYSGSGNNALLLRFEYNIFNAF